MSPWQAILLGVVEGLTEFLPVSSTGHLILAAALLHLRGEAVKTFEVVIQAGALLSVVGLYRQRAWAMGRGLMGQDPPGLRLLVNLLISFLPAAAVGVLCHHQIKARLFGTWPVVMALAVGGLVMVTVDRRVRARAHGTTRSLESIGLWDAVMIGVAQCLALWPGTSRSMVTILAGMWLGLPATVAAEYSFLLAVPILGAATVFDVLKGGTLLLHDLGAIPVVCGLVTSAIVAALAIRGFLRYLTTRGVEPFGWYRLLIAAAVWLLGRGGYLTGE